MIRNGVTVPIDRPAKPHSGEVTVTDMLAGLHPSLRPRVRELAAEFGVGVDRVRVLSPGRVEFHLR